jgi:hypothetical protein
MCLHRPAVRESCPLPPTNWEIQAFKVVIVDNGSPVSPWQLCPVVLDNWSRADCSETRFGGFYAYTTRYWAERAKDQFDALDNYSRCVTVVVPVLLRSVKEFGTDGTRMRETMRSLLGGVLVARYQLMTTLDFQAAVESSK